MENEAPGNNEIKRPDGVGGKAGEQEKEGIEKRPLFDEAADGNSHQQGEKSGGTQDQKPPSVQKKPSVTVKKEDKEKEEENLEEIEGDSSSKSFLKWVIIGGGGFIVALAVAFFLASLYLHKKEASLKKGESPRIAIQPVVKKQKRIVIKQYKLQPFFLRLKNSRTGEDKFLSAQIYIEFVREKLPDEIRSKKALLRTLIYKQLLKHFSDGKDSPEKERKFKEDLIPALNTFFRGGGVYDVGFSELVIR